MKKTYHIAVLALGLSLFGCGGGSGGGGGSADTTAPALLTQNPAGRLIQPDTGITLRFDESIDTTSFTLSGDLAAESDDGVWSQTDVIDDTLTLTPTSNWSVDTGRTLVINANDLAGNAMTELSLTYDVYTGTLYYVSSSAADDSGDGLTPEAAKRNVMAAITAASDAGSIPATVVVNAGDYVVAIGGTARITLIEGVSLYGGYNADFTERALGSSVITDQSNYSTTAENPNFALLGSEGITSATLIDGFTLQGTTQAGSNYTSAIRLRSGAAPTVQHNTINGGGNSVSNTWSYGIHNNAASPTVQNNTLNGGSGIWSYGMHNNANSSPTVRHNTLNGGGDGGFSHGMYNLDSHPFVENNIFNGGSGIDFTYGISNNGSSPTVLNNTLNGGSGHSGSYGMRNYSASHPLVENNIINGGNGGSSYGMYNLSSSPTVQNNTLNGGSGEFLSCGMQNLIDSSPIVQNNTIDGGSGGLSSYGMQNNIATPTVQNNTINGGSGGDLSYGIENIDSHPLVQNNTINGGSGGVSYAMSIVNGSSPAVLSNILITQPGADTYCFYEADTSSDPISLHNNNLVACEVLYRDENTTDIFDIDTVNALTGVSGNTYSETLAP